MQNLIKWYPMRSLQNRRRMMNRMFDSAYFYPPSSWDRSTNWDLSLDITENDDQFVVEASVPGVDPEDLEITYNDNVLTIKGEVNEANEVEEKQYHLRERRYGSFSRSVSLPHSIDVDAIEAIYKNGVLTLQLPKDEDAKPKKIKVHATGHSKVIEGKVKEA